MWWFRWHARRFFRSIMNPVNEEVAIIWHRRLRFLYIFFAFNAFIFTFKYWKQNMDKIKDSGLLVEDVTPSHRKARLMELGNVRIIRTGIGKPIETFDIDSKEYRREYEKKRKIAISEYQKKNKDKENNKENIDN